MNQPPVPGVVRDRLLLCGLAAVAYYALQRSYIPPHMADLIRDLALGSATLPEAPWFVSLLDAGKVHLGLDGFRASLWLNLTCGTLAIGWVHAGAAHILQQRGEAAALAGLFGCLPVIGQISTSSHVHGLLLLILAIGFWAAARYASRPSIGWALIGGFLAGAPALVHAHGSWTWLGGLLTVAIAPRCHPDVRTRMWPIHLVIAIATTGALLWGLDHASGSRAQILPSFDHHIETLTSPRFLESFQTMRMVAAAHVDWFRPFMPVSLLLLFRLFVPRLWLATVATLLATAFLLAQIVVLQPQPARFGYLLLPLTFPAGLLAVRCLQAKGRTILIGIAAVVMVIANNGSNAPRCAQRFADDLRQSGTDPSKLVALSFDRVFDDHAFPGV